MKNAHSFYIVFEVLEVLLIIIRKMQLDFTSADIIFFLSFRASYNIIWKKDFHHEFSFFNRFNQTPLPLPTALTAKIR